MDPEIKMVYERDQNHLCTREGTDVPNSSEGAFVGIYEQDMYLAKLCGPMSRLIKSTLSYHFSETSKF